MDQPNAIQLTKDLGREPSLETALHILQWELGDLTKSVVYMDWHPTLNSSYRAEAKHALGSLLFQAEVVAQLLGTNSEELFKFGVETVKDHITDMKKATGRFGYYTGGKKRG